MFLASIGRLAARHVRRWSSTTEIASEGRSALASQTRVSTLAYVERELCSGPTPAFATNNRDNALLSNNDFDESGFAIHSDVLDTSTIEKLLAQLSELEYGGGVQEGQTVYAMRDLLHAMPGVRSLAVAPSVRALVEPHLGTECFAVRAIYFDKLPGANWKVPWHQDLSVAVAFRKETNGFGPWSRKAGVPHAQAPVSLLERMLTVRLHLDACPLDNGPLRVLPGSHRFGKLDVEQIGALRAKINEVPCEIDLGGALVMRPLLLHASSAAEFPAHRRVVHIEYANTPLPNGLEWHIIVGYPDAENDIRIMA